MRCTSSWWILARRKPASHPALPASQRPLGRNLAAAPQPDRSGLTRHLTTERTQTIEASPGYPPVTCIPVPHPGSGLVLQNVVTGRYFGDGSIALEYKAAAASLGGRRTGDIDAVRITTISS